MKISHAIDILSPPEDVFLWIGSPERAMGWMTSVSRTEFLHRTPDMVGATFREVVADEKGSTELQGVVTDYRPNQRIAFHLYGPYNVVDVEYRLETIEVDADGRRALQVLSVADEHRDGAGVQEEDAGASAPGICHPEGTL